jgi:hypothetical protein
LIRPPLLTGVGSLLHRYRDADCAVRALRRAGEEILEDHVANCIEHPIASGDEREQCQKVNELISVLSRSAR